MRILKLTSATILCGLVFLLPVVTLGQTPSTEARLIRLEEGQKSLDKRFDDLNTRLNDLRSEINTRFTELREDMNNRFGSVDGRFDSVNGRFDSMDKRFDTMGFWFQLIMGALVLIIGGLVSQWLFLWRRVIRVETVVDNHLKETEKDLLLGYYRKELEELKQEVNRLKAKVAA